MNPLHLIKSYVFYFTSAFGISLTIKAHVGVSSFNSMNLAIAVASDIKVGTITTFFNLAFLLLYVLMTKGKYKGKYLLQAFSVLLFGLFINFFTYTLLGSLEVEHYGLRLIMITLGTIIGGMSVGMIVSYNAITFPIESVCNELADRTRFSFMLYRYGVDLFSISVSLLISLVFALPIYVREGTLISFLFLSFAMGSVVKFFKRRKERI